MTTRTERSLLAFVDRRKEMAVFDDLIKRSTEMQIAVVWGDTSSGKSLLLHRMMKSAKDAAVNGSTLHSVYVDWRPPTSWDYLSFMREVRKQLGPEHFPTFTSQVNLHYSEDPKVTVNINAGDISLLKDGTNSGTVGNLTGVHVHDLGITVPRGDLAIDESGRVKYLTAAFLEDLSALAAKQTIIFFLDTFEEASRNTITWLWDFLLNPVRDGTIGNLLFVVCGQKPPPDHEDWSRDIIDMKLPPLSEADIDEYLVRRGIQDPGTRTYLVAALLSQTDGQPGRIANFVDAMLKKISSSS